MPIDRYLKFVSIGKLLLNVCHRPPLLKNYCHTSIVEIDGSYFLFAKNVIGNKTLMMILIRND